MVDEELITEEEFLSRLAELGERMNAEGKPAIFRILKAVEEGLVEFRFENWSEHLKKQAYQKLGFEPVEPVLMYRKIRSVKETGELHHHLKEEETLFTPYPPTSEDVKILAAQKPHAKKKIQGKVDGVFTPKADKPTTRRSK